MHDKLTLANDSSEGIKLAMMSQQALYVHIYLQPSIQLVLVVIW